MKSALWVTISLIFLSMLGQGQVVRAETESAKRNSKPAQILVLNSYQYGLPVPDGIDRGIVATLRNSRVSASDVFIEKLDFSRMTDSEHRARLAHLLRHKLTGKSIKVVIAEGFPAVEFVAKEGRTFIPDSALVIAVTTPSIAPLLGGPHKLINLPWRIDTAGTISAALGLFPKTRRVLIVTGARELEMPFLDEAKEALAPLKDKLEIEFTNSIPYEEMIKRVSATPPDTVIIYSPYFNDVTGRSFVPAEVARTVARTANAPVFTVLNVYMGHGFVGGSLLKTERIGDQAAEAAVDYLEGRLHLVEPVTDLRMSAEMTFDWSALNRWNAQVTHLPKGSSIINRPSTLWEGHKFSVIAALSAIIILAILVILLAGQSRRRAIAEATARSNEERLSQAVRVGAIGIFDHDHIADTYFWSAEHLRIYGLDKAPTLEEFIAAIHPEDREMISTAVRFAHDPAGDGIFDVEFRFIRSDGAIRWNSTRSKTFFDGESGGRHPVRTIGAVRDVTEEKLSQEKLRAAKDYAERLLESANAMIVVLDDEGNVQVFNKAAREITGYSHDELISRDLFATLVPKDRYPTEWDRFRKPGQRGLPGSFENPILTKAGGERFISWQNTDLLENGIYRGSILYGIDVTERRRAEQALADEAVRRRILIEQSRDGIVILDQNGKVYEANKKYAEMLGYTPEEVLKLHVWDWDTKWKRDEILGMIRSLDETGDFFETKHRRKDGSLLDVEVSSNGTTYSGQKLIFCVCRDITERKLTERALRESEQRFRQLFEVAAVPLCLVSMEGVLLYSNTSFTQTFGYTKEDVPTLQKWWQLAYPDPVYRRRVADNWEAAVHHAIEKRTEIEPSEYRVTCKNGEVRTVVISASIIGDNFLAAFFDITERKRAETERERLMAAIEQASDTIIITDSYGTIQYVNMAFETVTGYRREEAIGRNPSILKSGRQDDAFYDQMWATISGGSTWGGRIINKRKDGTLYTEEATISPVRDATGRIVNYVASKRNITEQLLLEDQFKQAQKMESVGRLAGGVAHDFNNMLGVILGYTEVALMDTSPGSPLHAILTEIQKAADRSANLTRQLLAFARKQTIAPKVLDLNATVAGMLKMLQRIIGEDIDLAWVPGADLWPIKMDPSQIDQILANLCINARDAISGVGKITIETQNITLDEADIALYSGSVVGEYVMLVVGDNGYGMDSETQKFLFEPFFTTKEMGKGTGLGLSTVYGIVKQNNGFLSVHSELGKGTTFKIYIPRNEERGTDTRSPGAVTSRHGSGETVLLVEDETAILKMTERLLEKLGYTVASAASPTEAIRKTKEYIGEIHLLMTDVVMPEMNGHELAERLLADRPGMKILFTSGYTADIIAHHGVLKEGVHFIPKPFSLQELANKVRETLEAS